MTEGGAEAFSLRLPNNMSEFKIVSNYKPSGDQPKAIEDLSKGIIAGYSARKDWSCVSFR